MDEVKAYFEIDHKTRLGRYSMKSNHFHEDYEMYYLLAGERYYFVQDKVYVLQKGDMIFIDQLNLHRTGATGTGDHERILINVNQEYMEQFGSGISTRLFSIFQSSNKVLRFNTHEQGQVEQILFQMIYEKKRQSQDYHLYVHSLLTQLMIISNRMMNISQEAQFEHVNPTHYKMSTIAEYLNTHYMDDISLQKVSNLFDISPFYLSRTFKQVTGFGFVEYVNSVRIKEAQRLLRNTDLKIIKIAEIAGFDNIAHFGRVFKSFSRLSPVSYRKLAMIEIN